MLSRLGSVASLLHKRISVSIALLFILTLNSVTASIGQSTVLHADWVVEAACVEDSKYAIPQNLRHHLLISKFIARINCLMAEDKRSETGHPLERDICVLMNVLEQDFIDLERHIGRSLSGMTYPISSCCQLISA